MGGKNRNNVITLDAVRKQHRLSTDRVLEAVFEELVDSDTHREFILRFWDLIEEMSPKLRRRLEKRCRL